MLLDTAGVQITIASAPLPKCDTQMRGTRDTQMRGTRDTQMRGTGDTHMRGTCDTQMNSNDPSSIIKPALRQRLLLTVIRQVIRSS